MCLLDVADNVHFSLFIFNFMKLFIIMIHFSNALKMYSFVVKCYVVNFSSLLVYIYVA